MKTNPDTAAAGLPAAGEGAAEPWLRAVREKVTGLQYGTVQVIVHEGRVTQIESTERIRFERAAGASARP